MSIHDEPATIRALGALTALMRQLMMRASLTAPVLLAIVAVLTGSGHLGHAQDVPPSVEQTRPRYEIVSTPVKRVRGELTLRVTAPRLAAEEWTVFVARLPELPGQFDVRSTLVPGGAPTRDLSEGGRALLAARVPADGPNSRNELDVLVEYEATLVSRSLVKLKPDRPAPVVAALDPKTRRVELASGQYMDFHAKPFQQWLDAHGLRRKPSEGEVEFARRVFLEIKAEFQYEFTERMDRRASHVCAVGRSDCGGMAIVFASALRAHGVPTRLLAGRWATSSGPDSSSGRSNSQVHVKAEFFAQGVGWVPVDLSSAVLHDRSPEGLRYFGHDRGDFVTFHLDADMSVDTYFGRKTIEWLQIPSFWVTGSGSLDGLTAQTDWRVSSEPVQFREAVLRRPANAPVSSKPKTPKPAKSSRPSPR